MMMVMMMKMMTMMRMMQKHKKETCTWTDVHKQRKAIYREREREKGETSDKDEILRDRER